MEEIWYKACEYYKVPQSVSTEWYTRIKEQLNCSEHRAYHNWDEMMLRKSKDMLHLKASIVLAIFFQYYSFDPHKDCTQENCLAFKEFCSDAKFEDESSKSLILTLLGDTTSEQNDNYENEKNILQDLDLAILGASDDDYKHYTQLLRCEYSDVTNESYKSMRIKRMKSRIKERNKSRYSRSACLLKAAKKRLRKKKKSTQNGVRNTRKQRRYYNQCNTVNVPPVDPEDDDCICIEPTTECIIIEEDCDSGCVNLTNTDFSPENTSSPITMSNLATTKKNLNPYKTMFNGRNEKTTQVNANNLFFRDVSKMSTFVSDAKNYKLQISSFKHGTPSNNSPSMCDVIVIGDDSQINTTVSKARSSKQLNDSVEYVGGSSPKAVSDFIPLYNADDSVIFVDNDSCPKYNAKKNSKCRDKKNSGVCNANANLQLSTPCSSKAAREKFRDELFTLSEKKSLNKYNENTYNPNSDCKQLTDKRMVILDASNIAFSHSLNQCFSVKGLTICIEYFMKMGHEVKAVVPQFRFHRSSDPAALEKLRDERKIVVTPCKNLPGMTTISYDDRFILQLAYELDAVVVSNDNYRDLINENPAFKKIIENRVIGYTWCNDIFILPKDPYGKWGPSLQCILNRN